MRVLVILIGEAGRVVPDRNDWHPAECFAALYYALLAAGCDIVLASREGGPPVWGVQTAVGDGIGLWADRLAGDRFVRDELAETLRLEQIELEDFDALICLCPSSLKGQVTCTDLPLALLVSAIGQGKRVAILGMPPSPEFADRGMLSLSWTSGAAPSAVVADLLATLPL